MRRPRLLIDPTQQNELVEHFDAIASPSLVPALAAAYAERAAADLPDRAALLFRASQLKPTKFVGHVRINDDLHPNLSAVYGREPRNTRTALLLALVERGYQASERPQELPTSPNPGLVGESSTPRRPQTPRALAARAHESPPPDESASRGRQRDPNPGPAIPPFQNLLDEV